jgi:WD40 repeat protein
VKLWDVANQRERSTFGHSAAVSALAFSADGEWLGTGSSDRRINLWNLRRPGSYFRMEGHRRDPQALAFSPAGPLLASVSAERVVRLWAFPRNRAPAIVSGPEYGATAVAFSRDGRFLAAAGLNQVKLWEVGGWRQVQSLEIPGWLHALAFTGDDRCLALAATPEAVKLWDMARSAVLVTLPHEQPARFLAVAPGGGRVATATESGTLRIWEIPLSPARND